MPPAAPLIAGAAISAGLSAALGVTLLGLGIAGTAVLVFGASIALGMVSQALAPQLDFSVTAARHMITARQPAAARRLVVGATRIGGTIVYLGVTDSGRKLHVVVAFCEGPITAFEEIWFGDQRIDPGMIGSDGTVLDGRFAGLARIARHLGATDQAADTNLVAEVEEWTTAHRLQGIAYLYLRLERDANAFVNGLPQITARMRGPAILDVRDNTMRWTPNAALAQRAWLTDPRFGLGAAAAVNYALSFDGDDAGNNQYVTATAVDTRGDMTLESRFNADAASAAIQGTFIRVGRGADNAGALQHDAVDGHLIFHWYDGIHKTINSPNGSAPKAVSLHGAAVRESNFVTFYVNGIAVGAPQAVTTPTVAPVETRIGATLDVVQQFKGSLDEPRHWNVARTQPEIAANMNRRLAGTETGLVGYWPMDEGSGAVAADLTANGNDGAITGATWVVAETMPSAAGVEPEIDDADTAAAANICDEIVDVEPQSDTVVWDAAEDFLMRPGVAADSGHEQIGWPGAPTTGFSVRRLTGALPATMDSAGTPPAPLVQGRLYYVRWMTRASCRLANSAEKARKRKWIELDDTGSGTHELVHRTTDRDGELITKRTTVEAVARAASLRRAEPDAWGLRRGDRVTLSTTGTLPAPLSPATDYYTVPDLAGRTALAATLADAIDGVFITLTDAGSGVHTITRTGQVRYTANGLIVAGATPRDQLAGLMSASAGRVVHAGFTWRLFAGAAHTVITDLDEDDLAGPLRIVTKTTRRERFNGVKGVYVSPDNDGQPADYPPVRSATFAAADGETIDREIDLAFTDSPIAAQRIVKIPLLRSRQEIVVEGRWKLSALRLIASDWCSLSNAKYGWTAKAFEVLEWKFAAAADGALAIDAVLQEAAASDFDWASSEEQVVDPAPDTELPNPFEPAPPDGLQVLEETYETSGSAGVKARAVVTWVAPDDGFADRGGRYSLGLRASGEETFTIVARPTDTTFRIEDLAPGIYEFAVAAINRLGAESDWLTVTTELRGLLAPPAELTGLTLQAISAVAIFQWHRHPDLDVRQGGRIRIRHSELFAGALWQTSSEIVDAVPGDSVFATAPLKAGTYLFRVYDSSGVPSDGVVSVSTKAAEHLEFANIDTIVEDPIFVGTHNGTVAPDGVLKLAGLGLFDDIPDFDAVASLDIYGGIAASGTYDFAGGFDLGSVRTVRLESASTVLVRNLLDLIDDRAAPIDDWEDWDGSAAAEGDLSVWFRETDDDPSGSPTWSDWRRLTRADVEARGLDFQARLSISDPAYNIECSALAVSVEEVV